MHEEVPIEVAEGYGEDGGNTIDGQRFVEERAKECRGLWGLVEKQAIENRCYIIGRQWVSVDDDGNINREVPDGYGEQPFDRNMLRNLVPARCARLTEGRPSAKCWPNAAYGFDVVVSEMFDAVLRFVDNDNFDHVVLMAVLYQEEDGTSALRPMWDPEAGPRFPDFVEAVDPMTGEPIQFPHPRAGQRMGAHAVDALRFREFCTDNVDEHEHSTVVSFRSTKHWTEARRLLMEAGREDAAERISAPYSIGGGNEEGDDDAKGMVECLSTWVCRSDQFPEGLRIVSVAGEVVEHGPYPYPFSGETPLGVLKNYPVAGTPWGDTWVKDAIKPQRQLNDALNIKARRLRMLKRLFVVMDNVTAEKVNIDDNKDVQTIAVTGGERGKDWVFETVSIDDAKLEIFAAEAQDALDAIGRVAAMSPELVGGVGGAINAAGVSISYINHLENSKLALTAKSIKVAVRRVLKQILWLYQKFAPDELLLRVVGEQYAEFLDAFRAADLDGLDVKIEDASGLAESSTGTADEADQEMAAGMMTPENVEVAETGLDGTVDEATTMDVVLGYVDSLLSGVQVTLDETLNPAAAASFARKLAGAFRSHPNAAALLQLAQFYEQRAAGQQQPQPGAQQSAPTQQAQMGALGIPLPPQ